MYQWDSNWRFSVSECSTLSHCSIFVKLNSKSMSRVAKTGECQLILLWLLYPEGENIALYWIYISVPISSSALVFLKVTTQPHSIFLHAFLVKPRFFETFAIPLLNITPTLLSSKSFFSIIFLIK